VPWTVDNPPSPPVGDDWTEEEVAACVAAANAVLEEGGSEEDAIFACIHAAGRNRSETMPREEREIERRTVQVHELRVEQREGERPQILGHAAVFEQLSEDLGGFREQIAPGAFARAVREDDVRALWQHDDRYVLGRTRSGTLSLAEDEEGLAVDITPPDTQWARDFTESIRRGDVDQMSFGFLARRDVWVEDEQGEVIRTLLDVQLFDVSPVTFPAYPQTSVEARNRAQQMQAPEPDRGRAIEILRRRLDLEGARFSPRGDADGE